MYYLFNFFKISIKKKISDNNATQHIYIYIYELLEYILDFE